MIYPFSSNNGVLLRDRYSIDLKLVEQINSTFSNTEFIEFVKLYITEGIPFAFKSNPLIFEDIRFWLGKHLNVETKNIILTGSSRIGFSLSPQKWGKQYQSSSDLDFIIVSEQIFEKYKKDFKEFVFDIQKKIENKEIINDFYLKNIESVSNSILRAKFIDQTKIPINEKYKNIYKAYDVLAHLLKRMNITNHCPNPSKASIRVYKDWTSCIEQLNKNFKNAFKYKIIN